MSSAMSKELPLYQVTADGTWDCKDPAGTNMGTIVVAEKTYAYIKTDGRLGGTEACHSSWRTYRTCRGSLCSAGF